MIKRICFAVNQIRQAKNGEYLECPCEMENNAIVYGPKNDKCPVCGHPARKRQGYICESCGWEMDAEGTKAHEWTGENPVSVGTYKVIYKFYCLLSGC